MSIRRTILGNHARQLRLSRVLSSPTMMTWASAVARSLNIIVILPLVLTRLPTADIALWYLFSSILALQILADLGFGSTFVRLIAYGLAGSTTGELGDRRIGVRAPSRQANWETVGSICATMRVVYARLSLIACLALGSLGTWAVSRPIALSSHTGDAWLAWGVIVVSSLAVLRGYRFAAFLQGVNQVALFRRWEAIANLGAVATGAVVLISGGGLLGLVVSHQAWLLINVLRNWWLCGVVEEGRFRGFGSHGLSPAVYSAAWPSAWRSGIGAALGQAPVQMSGIIYAQIGAVGGIASYLLAINLLTAIRGFSMGPFYSKLPRLARLRAEGKLTELGTQARRGMGLSYWTFVVLLLAFGLGGNVILAGIGSNANFPERELWLLLGIGMFVERFGAMHLHLYSTTNHITWHTVNGATTIIFAVVAAALFRTGGVYAFAVAYIVSYVSFYAWYAARLSYSALNLRFWGFERHVSIVPAVILVGYAAIIAALGWGSP